MTGNSVALAETAMPIAPLSRAILPTASRGMKLAISNTTSQWPTLPPTLIARKARSSSRYRSAPSYQISTLGCRPAMGITTE